MAPLAKAGRTERAAASVWAAVTALIIRSALGRGFGGAQRSLAAMAVAMALVDGRAGAVGEFQVEGGQLTALPERSSARIRPTSPKPIRAIRVSSAAPHAGGHIDLAVHQLARGAQQGGAAHLHRAVLRLDVHGDGEEAGGMLDLELDGAIAGEPGVCQSGTEPGSTQAVATLTAPKTPMASWTRCGMKVRVQIAPPSRGAAISVILGTVFFVTSPRFIGGPAARRIASTLWLSVSASASSSVGRLVAGLAEV